MEPATMAVRLRPILAVSIAFPLLALVACAESGADGDNDVVVKDAGTDAKVDSGAKDAGVDAAKDAGPTDSGSLIDATADTGVVDPPDTGVVDPPDAGGGGAANCSDQLASALICAGAAGLCTKVNDCSACNGGAGECCAKNPITGTTYCSPL
jgi:hypothetical protein